jgi:hypothetical protein
MIKYNNFFDEEGELIIGGLPHEYDKNYNEEQLRTAKIYLEGNLHPEWRLQFIKSFIISNKNNIVNEYIINANNIASFNIEEFFILGSDDYYNLIQKIFFKEYFSRDICRKQNLEKSKYVKNYFYIICYFNGDKTEINSFFKNFPIIKFYQSDMNYNFTLNATDLFTIIPDNNRVLFNVEFLENYNSWVFGKPFFKKYRLIFDDNAKVIKYYLEIENNDYNSLTVKDGKIYRYIIIIVLLILFITSFSFGFYCSKYLYIKFNNKKKGLELKDEYLFITKEDDL